jgi:hypothetical protein
MSIKNDFQVAMPDVNQQAGKEAMLSLGLIR